jgi:hypothetical protein
LKNSGDPNKKKYFKPISIKATVILGKNQLTATCGSKIGVNQKFSISYRSGTTTHQKKSGNPGYLDGLSLKLAS